MSLLRQELNRINTIIDEKITRGISYAHEARLHRRVSLKLEGLELGIPSNMSAALFLVS